MKNISEAKDYQKGNFDMKTNNVTTEDGAGVMLYSLSGTTRSSAKEAREAKDYVAKAKKEGILSFSDEVTVDNLKKSGMSESEAYRYGTAYEINQAAKQQVQREDVMEGFGSNGGEELISYLLTGESIMLQGGNEWRSWYETMHKRIIAIQKNDGSWEGHHCITSPVFCTAAALLILSISNDMEE